MNITFSYKNFLNLKNSFSKLIKERMKSLKNRIFCPLLNDYITTKEILNFFSFSLLKGNKSFVLTYSKKPFKGLKPSSIIKSIDYGTIDYKPMRIFYPLFNEFYNKFLCFLF